MTNIVPFNPEEAAAILERLLIQGDLASLNHHQRAEYYIRVCNSVGLNPYTQPFEYLKLNGKLKLYALKGCTDQLRRLHRISLAELSRAEEKDVFIVTARATTPDGRADIDIGVVPTVYPEKIKDYQSNRMVAHPKAGKRLEAEDMANAMMKAATKAKRRATLAICGLGLLDETEADSIPGAVKVAPDWPSIENRSAALPPPRRAAHDKIDPCYEAEISADRKAARKPPQRAEAFDGPPEPPPYDYVPEMR